MEFSFHDQVFKLQNCLRYSSNMERQCQEDAEFCKTVTFTCQNWAWSGRYSTNPVILEVNVVPLHAKQAQRGDKTICCTITHPDSGWMVRARPRQLYSLEHDPVCISQEAGWASGPIWIGGKSPPPTGIRNRTSRYFYKRKYLHYYKRSKAGNREVYVTCKWTCAAFTRKLKPYIGLHAPYCLYTMIINTGWYLQACDHGNLPEKNNEKYLVLIYIYFYWKLSLHNNI